MGEGQRRAGYAIEIDPEAKDDLKQLSPEIRNRVGLKIEWLALNHDQIRHEAIGVSYIGHTRKREKSKYMQSYTAQRNTIY